MKEEIHFYKVSEWQSPTGNWHVNDVSNLSGIAGHWWVPARLLKMTPADYIAWLIKNYQPDEVRWVSDKKLFFFSWNKENYSKAHSYYLFMNRQHFTFIK